MSRSRGARRASSPRRDAVTIAKSAVAVVSSYPDASSLRRNTMLRHQPSLQHLIRSQKRVADPPLLQHAPSSAHDLLITPSLCVYPPNRRAASVPVAASGAAAGATEEATYSRPVIPRPLIAQRVRQYNRTTPTRPLHRVDARSQSHSPDKRARRRRRANSSSSIPHLHHYGNLPRSAYSCNTEL